VRKAAALRLREMVAYAKDSIVSQTLIDRKTGSLTLFAFDRGQHLSEHTAPCDACVHVLDGRAELVIGGKPLVVSAGELAIMPAGVPHAVRAIRRFKMLLIMIRS